MKRMILTSLLGLGLLGQATAQDDPIRFGYVLWDSETAVTHVMATVLQEELGQEVELVAVDAGPMYISLAQGELDLSVSVALPLTHAAYWEQYGDQLVDLGPYHSDAQVGLVVPEYVTIDSIGELNEAADQFDGQIIGIDPGAGIMALTEEALDLYGLDQMRLVDSSDAAMVAAIDRAVNRGDWVVVTGWDPHWKWAVYDLKYLADPEGLYGEVQGANTVLSQDFADRVSDEVLSFLDNFEFPAEHLSVVMLDINQEGKDPWEAAADWIADNRDIVDGWLQ